MSCNHEWSEECYDVVPSQVCVRCNAFLVEEEEAKLVRDAFARGAEEMRLACQQWCRAWENNGEAIADALADLRVEDKP